MDRFFGLYRFVWTLQRRQAQNDLREDVCEQIRIGIQLGEQFVGLFGMMLLAVLSLTLAIHLL